MIALCWKRVILRVLFLEANFCQNIETIRFPRGFPHTQNQNQRKFACSKSTPTQNAAVSKAYFCEF